MRPRPVSFVRRKLIARVAIFQQLHQPIAADLGDDRRRHDRRLQSIAPDYRLLVEPGADLHVPVDENLELKLPPGIFPDVRVPEPAERKLHREPRRLPDVQPVNPAGADRDTAESKIMPGYLIEKLLARRGREKLRVLQPLNPHPLGKKHRSSGHRTGERSAPRFINPDHAAPLRHLRFRQKLSVSWLLSKNFLKQLPGREKEKTVTFLSSSLEGILSLSEKEVLHVAKLARLELSPDEISHIQQELNEILNYVGKLSKVSTRGVAPTSHVHGISNIFRDDVVGESLSIDHLRQIAPDFVVSSFRVPKIL
jgi:aspartyl-tRNA(Asn)/glutamyl-tRNA(Gln) amidotransferase subunit C